MFDNTNYRNRCHFEYNAIQIKLIIFYISNMDSLYVLWLGGVKSLQAFKWCNEWGVFYMWRYFFIRGYEIIFLIL